MRVKEHPIIDFKHGRKVAFTFEGKTLYGYEGEPVAASLVDNGILVFRYSLRKKRPHGFFCAIGKCSSCLMEVDGIPNVRTCITPLKEGMAIRRQKGKGELRR